MKQIELDACRQTIELLPWYANESLDEAERERVDAHLADCAACRQEARFLSAFVNELPEARAANENAPPFGELLQRINRRERQGHSWKIAAALAFLAVLVAALALPQWLSPRYVTVTDPSEAHGGRAYVQIVLAPPADAGTLSEVMQKHEATLVSGPDESGAYLLVFPLGKTETAEQLVRRLQEEKTVLDARAGEIAE